MADDHEETEACVSVATATPIRGIRQPRCSFFLEPLLVIAAISSFPLGLLLQQYIFQQMAKVVAKDHGIVNFTLPDTSVDPCAEGQPGNGTPIPPLVNYTGEIQAMSAHFMIYSNLAAAVPSLFVTIFLGAYSDKAGRKYAIVPPLVSFLARSVLCVLIVSLELSVYYLLVGSFIEGLGGGYQTLLLGVFAYIADVTPPEKRSFRIVLAEFCMFASGILAPAGVGVWIQKSGYLPPFFLVLIGQSVSVAYAIFLLPETIIGGRGARFFTCAHVKDTISLFTKDNGTGRRWKLTCLLLAFFVYGSVALGSSSVTSLFEMNHPLCWGSNIIGIYSAVYVAVAATTGVILTRVMKMCLSDNVICLAAGVFATLQHVYLGFVVVWQMMIFVPLFACVGMLFTPTIRAIMSKLVLPDEQGAMFGAIACLEVVCMLVGGVLLNVVYVSTMSIHTGFVFWVMAIIIALACGILVFVLVRTHHERNRYGPLVQTEVTSPAENT